MKILICCAESKKYILETSFIQAFKDIGHEVTTCGCKVGNYEGELTGNKDIKVHDKRQHPESYSYDEILSRLNFTPDLIIQTDSHFYFTGTKPRGIKSAYYILDAHRGADVFRRMALEGSFDYVFITQKYFMPLFEHVGLNCHWLPIAYDDTFIMDYPEIEQRCDIVFVGETGLSDELNVFDSHDCELDVSFHRGAYPLVPPERRYRSWENHSMEYAERAEILIRLSRDFDLHVYKPWGNCEGSNYAKAMNRGKIVVNHSLWFDSACRNLEVLGCNRFLMADILPFQHEIIKNGVHYVGYRKYFLPFLSNFDLEYEQIKKDIDYYLKHESKRKRIARSGHEHVKKYHTWRHRAKKIIDIVFGR